MKSLVFIWLMKGDFMEIIGLLLGFLFLIKGADAFVDGASALARLLRIPSVIIGLTIVAMGTSAPEASVSITAGLAGSNEIALGNVIGSNIFNSLVVVGLCAIIYAFSTDKDILKRDLPVNIGVSVLLGVLLLDGTLSRLDGCILLVLMAGYIGMMIHQALKERTVKEEDEAPVSLVKSLIFIALGLAAVIFGGNLVVDNATILAQKLGMSETFIGLTIVAIGTSLPELVTSLVASRKKESGLALGNAIGSNIFNILFILGMSAVLSPIPAAAETMIDVVLMSGVAVLMLVFAGSKKGFSKLEGILCVALYVMYTAYLFIR